MPKSAIQLRSNVREYMVDKEQTDENIVIVILPEFVLISMYFNSFNSNKSLRKIEDDLVNLQKIVDKFSGKPLILLCDSNSSNLQDDAEDGSHRHLSHLNKKFKSFMYKTTIKHTYTP